MFKNRGGIFHSKSMQDKQRLLLIGMSTAEIFHDC